MIGEGLDEVQARNAALIEQRLGRRLSGTVTLSDAVAMSQAGLGDDVIITHIQTHGMERPLTAADLISLKQQGVSDAVLRAMQTAPPRPVGVPEVVHPPMIVEQHHHHHPFGPPYWYRRPHYRMGRRHGVSWGFSITK
jgi:hypothetical protein